jgi:lysylphosphatidylglycerol synthetase-like protein (DUF2156 family)
VKIVPLSHAAANELVAKLHRHHKPIRTAKFSIGAEHNDVLVGAVMCMRPACRSLDDGATIEVCRLVSDGTPHVCSFLYGAAARAAKELGYTKI